MEIICFSYSRYCLYLQHKVPSLQACFIRRASFVNVLQILQGREVLGWFELRCDALRTCRVVKSDDNKSFPCYH